MAASRAQQAAIAISNKSKGIVPKGYHKMPDGSIMKNSAHKKKVLKKAQLGTNTGPQGSVVKSNINAKIAGAAGAAGSVIGLLLERHRRKKAKRQEEKVKSDVQKEVAEKGRYGGTKMRKGGTPAWTRKEGKNPTGGLNAKGVASYRAANPGSKLQTAVTTKPSKLKAGSKDAKRRKSFCARMSGMPGPMKDEKGRPTRKALSLRKWNC